MDTLGTETKLAALTQYIAARIVVPGASAVAEVKAIIDSGSGTTAMLEELVDVLRKQAKICKPR